MSLNWSLKGIEDYENVCWIPESEDDSERSKLNPVTHALIFGTISARIGQITQANWKEFYARYHIIEKLDGPFLIGSDGPEFVKPEEVKQHIGLSTNVQDESRASFYKNSLTPDLDSLIRSCKDA